MNSPSLWVPTTTVINRVGHVIILFIINLRNLSIFVFTTMIIIIVIYTIDILMIGIKVTVILLIMYDINII